MPGKSKHGKGRRTQYKNKARQPQTAGTVNSASSNAATAPTSVKPAAAAIVKPAAPSKVTGYKPATTADYPFFSSELKRIAVLTLILLAVLIILAFIIK